MRIMIHRTVVVTLDALPAVLSIIGNSIFMLTIYKTPSLHTPSNVLLGILCISDFLVGIIVQPLFFANFLWEHWCYPAHILTDVYYYAYALLSGFSLILAGFLSIDRYVAICHPFRYTRTITCKSYIVLAGISAFVWALCSGSIFKEIYDFWAVYVVVEIFAISTILICYVRIYCVMRKLRRSVVAVGAIVHRQPNAPDINRKKEHEKTCTIAIILGFFLVSYSVEFVRSLHYLIIAREQNCKVGNVFFVMDMWADFLVLANSCVNPIVYCARSSDIRKAAVRIFRPHLVSATVENSRNSSMPN